MIVACGEDGASDVLSQAREVIEQSPDSAKVLLSQVDTSLLTEEGRAEYNLLETMVNVKKQRGDLLSDSLIATSVSYYNRHGDQWHRASAYYYRGVVNHAKKQHVDAIKYFKTAEALAEPLDDELLHNKIYERIAYANYALNNIPEILRYSQKLLKSSLKMRDSAMIARSYTMVASGFANMGQMDSAYVNVIKSLDYIDALTPQIQSDLIFNVATYYQETGNMEKAEQYLTDWVIKNSSSNFCYITLARIRQKQGKTEEAIEYAKRALDTKDYKIHYNAMSLLADLYSQQGDSSRAYALKKQCEEFADSLEHANKTIEMALWQMSFDEQQNKQKELRKVYWWLGIIGLLLLIVAVIWWWHRHRLLRLRFRLDDNIRQMNEYQSEIERLSLSGEANVQEISRLKEQIEQHRERVSAKLLTGTQLFSRIAARQSLTDVSAADLQSLVEYFAQLRPKRWQAWERQYSELTTAQYIFLILQDDLHYDDKTIATILDVKRASVRSMRSRIKAKEK